MSKIVKSNKSNKLDKSDKSDKFDKSDKKDKSDNKEIQIYEENSITNKKIYKLIDLYFNDKFIMYKMQYDSYNQFINEIVYKTLTESENIIYVSEDKEKNVIYEYSFRFLNININYPTNEQNEIIYPEDARKNHLSYSSKLFADVQ